MVNGSFNPFLIRSWLFVPAIKERFIQKLFTLKGQDKPDAVIFDLEDSVADTSQAKDDARNRLLNYLFKKNPYKNKLFSSFIICIRINNHLSLYSRKDVDVVKKIQPHFVVIPKIESGEEVQFYQQTFKNLPLRVAIESILGYKNTDAIAKALRPTDLMAIGYEDLSADLGIERPDNLRLPNPLVHIINCCIIAAKEHNILIIDGPSRKYGSRNHLKNLTDECLFAVSMGFHSKGAIHPSQVKIINKTFSKEKLQKHAKGIIQQFEALADGTFVIGSNQEMMDKPSFTLYSKTLKRFHQS